LKDFDTEYMSWTIPISTRDMLDFGLGTEDQRRQARLDVLAEDAEDEHRWMALPLRVRAWRVLRGEARWTWHRFTGWLHYRMFGCEGGCQ
jgi:hypothetical protein